MINKMRQLFMFVSVVTLMLQSPVLYAESDTPAEQSSPKAEDMKLENLSWMVGQWTGEAFGGVCEETWTPLSGGTMIGTFKLIHGDKAGMYEIMMISIVDGKPVMKLKHFNGDLTGWEEKNEMVTFPFLEMSENEIKFDGLTYKRTADELLITVATGGEDGQTHESIIKCKRSSF